MTQVPKLFDLDLPPQGFKTAQRLSLIAGFIFAFMGTLFMFVFLNQNLGWKPAPPPRIIVIPFCGIFIIVGVSLIFFALHSAWQRVIIKMTNTQLLIKRRGLLFRRIELDRRRLKDISITVRQGSSDALHLCSIGAYLTSGESRFLLQRYGKEETTRICEALRAMLFPGTPAGAGVPPTVTLATRGDELHIHLGPMPLNKVLAGLYPIARAFLFIAPIMLAIILGVVFYMTKDGLALVLAPVMGTLAMAVIIGLAVAGMKWARRVAAREAKISITDALLQIEIIDAAKPAIHKIDRNKLTDVCLGPSQISANDVPLPLLKITQQDAAPIELFEGRDPDELAWLEKTLRSHLVLSPRAPQSQQSA